MTAAFGDFLDAASNHIGAACRDGDLPSGAAPAVARELDRLVVALMRYLGDLKTGGGSSPAAAGELALQHAAAALSPVAGTAASPSPRGVAADLSAAAMLLTAGRDMLQTHFRPGPAGSVLVTSHWAPAVTARPVTTALLAELSGYSHRLARWSAQVSLSGPPESPETRAFSIASRALGDAAAALHDNRPGRPSLAGRTLLRAIPANAPPPRHEPTGGEPIEHLCAGATTTSERLRYLTRPVPGAADAWPEIVTAASWQHSAQAITIVCHASELILRSLARRISPARMDPTVTTDLRWAAISLGNTWPSTRAVGQQLDPITTGPSEPLTPIDATTADLVLWIGRLAYHDPAWRPSRLHTSTLREPAELAAKPGAIRRVLAAVHHAIDAAARLLAADQAAIRAAASRHLFIPTRLRPDRHHIPYPYAPVPSELLRALLDRYDAGIRHITRAVAVLDAVAIKIDAPSAILGMARARAQEEKTTPPTRPKPPAANRVAARAAANRVAARAAAKGKKTTPPTRPEPPATDRVAASANPPLSIVQRLLPELAITDPALLERAARIDEATKDHTERAAQIDKSARELIAELIAISGRRDADAGGPVAQVSDRRPTPLPAHITAKDFPVGIHQRGPTTANRVAARTAAKAKKTTPPTRPEAPATDRVAASANPPLSIVQRLLREGAITDPALLERAARIGEATKDHTERAAQIDKSARELIAELIAISGRRDADAGGPVAQVSDRRPTPLPAHITAKDFPVGIHQRGPTTPGRPRPPAKARPPSPRAPSQTIGHGQ